MATARRRKSAQLPANPRTPTQVMVDTITTGGVNGVQMTEILNQLKMNDVFNYWSADELINEGLETRVRRALSQIREGEEGLRQFENVKVNGYDENGQDVEVNVYKARIHLTIREVDQVKSRRAGTMSSEARYVNELESWKQRHAIAQNSQGRKNKNDMGDGTGYLFIDLIETSTKPSEGLKRINPRGRIR